MIHLRTDDHETNANRRFACGIGPKLPDGDTWFYVHDLLADVKADCPGCNPHPRQLGTPLSELHGRGGGNEAWRALSASWGYP